MLVTVCPSLVASFSADNNTEGRGSGVRTLGDGGDAERRGCSGVSARQHGLFLSPKCGMHWVAYPRCVFHSTRPRSPHIVVRIIANPETCRTHHLLATPVYTQPRFAPHTKTGGMRCRGPAKGVRGDPARGSRCDPQEDSFLGRGEWVVCL